MNASYGCGGVQESPRLIQRDMKRESGVMKLYYHNCNRKSEFFFW